MSQHILFLALACAQLASSDTQPNIVFIIADDLGYNDVSWHGSDQIPTPNIDVLASSGVALHRYYSHSLCTPSRSALLTGKFAYKTGMQGYPLTSGEARGIPLTEKLLPQYFKDLGYATHLVGKWHVGSYKKEYLPTYRGYDTFYGNTLGCIDYYEYTLEENWDCPKGKFTGFDLYRNETADWAAEGYVTDLYNHEAIRIISQHDTSRPLLLTLAHVEPHSGNDGSLLQVDPREVRAMRHIEETHRRYYAGTWCLYNIVEDPCEKQDISVVFPAIAETLYRQLQVQMASRIPRTYPKQRNEKALPKYFNYTWHPWA